VYNKYLGKTAKTFQSSVLCIVMIQTIPDRIFVKCDENLSFKQCKIWDFHGNEHY